MYEPVKIADRLYIDRIYLEQDIHFKPGAICSVRDYKKTRTTKHYTNPKAMHVIAGHPIV